MVWRLNFHISLDIVWSVSFEFLFLNGRHTNSARPLAYFRWNSICARPFNLGPDAFDMNIAAQKFGHNITSINYQQL